jgi:hypothetical protein
LGPFKTIRNYTEISLALPTDGGKPIFIFGKRGINCLGWVLANFTSTDMSRRIGSGLRLPVRQNRDQLTRSVHATLFNLLFFGFKTMASNIHIISMINRSGLQKRFDIPEQALDLPKRLVFESNPIGGIPLRCPSRI